MSSNPFRFGTGLEAQSLIGRDRERDEIVRLVHEGRTLALVSPRGTGKTSLIHAALAVLRRQSSPAIYVDLFPAINTQRFAEIYASALTMGRTKTVEAMQEALAELVPSITPRVTINGAGKPGLQLDLWDRERDIRALLDRILDAPQQIAKNAPMPAVVVFDDFEDLVDVGDANLLHNLAQTVRRHRGVSYVFVLRKESTTERIFNEPTSAFFRLADPVRLDAIPKAEMVGGLQARFSAAGVTAGDRLVEDLLDLAEQVPHNVQMLAHALFEEARDKNEATPADLKEALSHVLEAGAYAFKNQWDQLSPHQRNLVLAIAQGHTERLQSQRIVFQLGLGSPSTVSKNLKTLIDREILHKRGPSIGFVDPFLGLWLQRRMT